MYEFDDFRMDLENSIKDLDGRSMLEKAKLQYHKISGSEEYQLAEERREEARKMIAVIDVISPIEKQARFYTPLLCISSVCEPSAIHPSP